MTLILLKVCSLSECRYLKGTSADVGEAGTLQWRVHFATSKREEEVEDRHRSTLSTTQ